MGPDHNQPLDFDIKTSTSFPGAFSGVARENTTQSQAESDQPTPMLGGGAGARENFQIAESLRSKEGGEEFFRATNVFA